MYIGAKISHQGKEGGFRKLRGCPRHTAKEHLDRIANTEGLVSDLSILRRRHSPGGKPQPSTAANSTAP
jgi:hypothetical protein